MFPTTPPNLPPFTLPPQKEDPKVNEGIVDLLFSKIDLNFKFLDEELEKQGIPKDLTELIFSYAIPYCSDCSNCCSICKFYCSIECLRYERADSCCKHELNQLLKKYE